MSAAVRNWASSATEAGTGAAPVLENRPEAWGDADSIGNEPGTAEKSGVVVSQHPGDAVTRTQNEARNHESTVRRARQ